MNCYRCKTKPPAPNRGSCQPCLSRAAELQNARRHAKYLTGLCHADGCQSPPSPNYVYCQRHRDIYAVARKLTKAKVARVLRNTKRHP